VVIPARNKNKEWRGGRFIEWIFKRIDRKMSEYLWSFCRYVIIGFLI